MEIVLYLIDPTARQYGFQFDSGFTIGVDGNVYELSEEVDVLGIMYDVIENDKTFIIRKEKFGSVFKGSKIIGAKIDRQ